MRSLLAMLLVSFAFVLQLSCAAAAQTGEALHIGVQARYLDGSPMEDLRAVDFVVLAQGVRVNVTSSQPRLSSAGASTDLPVHALLMIAAESELSSEAAIANVLTKELPESFGNLRLAVFERNGQLTVYTQTRTELLQQLRGFGNKRSSSRLALAELGRYPGRHALIYYTEKGVDAPVQIKNAASAAAALIYQVGGNKAENYVQGSEQSSGIPSIPQGDHFLYGPADDAHGGVGILLPSADVYTAVWTRSVRQVIVERSLKRALRNLTADGLGYYDLSLLVPRDTPRLDLRLNARQDYQLTVQPYTLDKRTPPDIHLPTRQ